MRFKDQLKYAVKNLQKKKKEAFLTGLSVMIGVAAIVSMIALSQGFEKSIIGNLEENLNTKVLTIMGSRGAFFERAGGGPPGMGGGSSIELSADDIDDLEAIDHVDNATATFSQEIQISLGDIDNTTIRATVVGIDFAKYNYIYNNTFIISEGKYNTDTSNFTVIGYQLQYPSEEIEYGLNSLITITWQNSTNSSQSFAAQIPVSGILNETGSNSRIGGPSDSTLYILDTLYLSLFDTDTPNSIVLLLDDDDSDIISEVQTALNTFYGGQVLVMSAGSMISSVQETFETTELFLEGVAAISLIVAGVGIMNIMTVSLIQRKREIGLLKSMGTSDGTILSIFLEETSIIGIFGSAMGLIVGWLLALILGSNMGSDSSSENVAQRMMQSSSFFSSNITPYIDPWTVVLIFLFGIAITIIFGLIPAWRASRLEPVETLKEE